MQCFYKFIDRLPQAEAAAPPGSPIVVPDPLMVLTFRHYAPADVAARVVLPLDFPAIRFFVTTTLRKKICGQAEI